MIIAEYLNTFWIQESVESLNTNFNYLISRGIPYIEIKEYFLKNYGIAVEHAQYVSTDYGVKLCLTLHDREIDIMILYTISSDIIVGHNVVTDDDMHVIGSCIYILLDIDQTVEQL